MGMKISKIYFTQITLTLKLYKCTMYAKFDICRGKTFSKKKKTKTQFTSFLNLVLVSNFLGTRNWPIDDELGPQLGYYLQSKFKMATDLFE